MREPISLGKSLTTAKKSTAFLLSLWRVWWKFCGLLDLDQVRFISPKIVSVNFFLWLFCKFFWKLQHGTCAGACRPGLLRDCRLECLIN